MHFECPKFCRFISFLLSTSIDVTHIQFNTRHSKSSSPSPSPSSSLLSIQKSVCVWRCRAVRKPFTSMDFLRIRFIAHFTFVSCSFVHSISVGAFIVLNVSIVWNFRIVYIFCIPRIENVVKKKNYTRTHTLRMGARCVWASVHEYFLVGRFVSFCYVFGIFGLKQLRALSRFTKNTEKPMRYDCCSSYTTVLHMDFMRNFMLAWSFFHRFSLSHLYRDWFSLRPRYTHTHTRTHVFHTSSARARAVCSCACVLVSTFYVYIFHSLFAFFLWPILCVKSYFLFVTIQRFCAAKSIPSHTVSYHIYICICLNFIRNTDYTSLETHSSTEP